MLDSVETGSEALAAWAELEAHLKRQSRELSDEVRRYPGPIARCDVQLTKLIEQRTRALDLSSRAGALDPAPDRLRAFVAAYVPGEDAAEAALVARLKETLR
jgi:hypothetical protein